MVYGANTITQADHDLCRTHHWVDIIVYILDNERRYLFDMSSALINGTVDIDTEADCSRSGKMSLLDPQQRLSIDLNGSGWGSNMSNRTVQIIYKLTNMDRTYSYSAPIFTGPITYAARDGAVLNIDFKGFEWIMQGGQLSDYSWPIGWSRGSIIQNAAAMNGLPYTTISHAGGIMYSSWAVESGDNLWERLKELADGGGLNIYFDGNGVLQVKPKWPGYAMALDTTWLTEEPDFNLDASKIRNVVRVEGGKIPGTDTVMTYEAWPSPQHPFSPQSLARFGQPRVLPHIIRDSSLTVWSDVINTAWQTLTFDLLVAESTSAVIPVCPWLEEFDVLAIRHPKCATDSPLTKATIPLVGDGEMSIGMLTTSSTGNASGPGARAVSNKGLNGERLLHHGPSGAFNTLRGPKHSGNKGANWYTGEDGGKGAPNKGKKKKNRDKGKGKGKK